MHFTSPKRRAYTLVELSIVLVIIALLVGGILAGKNMVRAAQLRSVMTDAQNYLTAVNTFRTQYKYLPGDMPNAVSYWGTTADGNGDGIVATGTNSEEYRVWDHLNLAEMITPKLSGSGTASIPGTNVPASRVPNTGFAFFYFNNSAGGNYIYTANYLNTLTFGAPIANSEPTSAALTPADAFTIDTKADDGKPGTGKWIANSTGGGVWGNASACTTSTGATDLSGTYNISSSVVACSFFILSGY